MWRTFVALIGGGVLAASGAWAQDDKRASPMPSHLPLSTDACFGRSYDAAHLKRHPKQRVTAFHILRDFSPDTTSEITPENVEDVRKVDGQYGSVLVSAYVRFRDRRGVFWNILNCGKSERGVNCGVDCDGGSFRLSADGAGLRVDNGGFVVVGGCGGEEMENAKDEFVRPEPDDKTFRLNRLPIAACLAERDAQQPSWVALGPPLRERLAKPEALCWSRSYDATHLARHSQQTVRRMMLVRPATEQKGPDDGDYQTIRLRVETRSGRSGSTEANCSAERAAWSCLVKGSGDDVSFFLVRAKDGGVTLRDRAGRLGKSLGLKLGSDDRTFRLDAAQASACGG